MTTITLAREELLQTLQSLPDDRVMVALDLIRALQDEDDEPLTEDELAQLAASEADIAAGRMYTLEEVERRLALLS
jgi:predicted transcriptional regulator